MEDELVVLDAMLHALRLDDVYVWFDESGVLQAEDEDDNRWSGKEFYEFMTEECLDFEPDGTLSEGMYVKEELLERYKVYSTKYGVIPGKPSQDENGGV